VLVESVIQYPQQKAENFDINRSFTRKEHLQYWDRGASFVRLRQRQTRIAAGGKCRRRKTVVVEGKSYITWSQLVNWQDR
jgi:hypothetical protein